MPLNIRPSLRLRRMPGQVSESGIRARVLIEEEPRAVVLQERDVPADRFLKEMAARGLEIAYKVEGTGLRTLGAGA